METTIYKCDNCGKEAKDVVPAGWFLLGFAMIKHLQFPEGIKLKTPIANKPDWQITHHFCSEQCMNEAVKVKFSPTPNGEGE